MIATVINAIMVFIGSAAGIIFKSKISKKYSDAIIKGIGLCVVLIGAQNAFSTENMLCVILCMVIGIVIGEMLRIEDRLGNLGDLIKERIFKGRAAGQFTEGFMSATLLFCVGAMSVKGSMDAGISGDYAVLLSKSVMDCITAITLAAALGIGVLFSGFSVLLYQGALTLLAILVGPILPTAVVVEMSATGGLIIAAIGLNMLELTGENKLKIGNMLPAMFLPIGYIPLANWITGLF